MARTRASQASKPARQTRCFSPLAQMLRLTLLESGQSNLIESFSLPAPTPQLPASQLLRPNATSSQTVGQNSWSSGSWNRRPTWARIRARCGSATLLKDTHRGWRVGARQQAVEVEQQGGLAGAVRPDQAHALSFRHRKRRCPARLPCPVPGNGNSDEQLRSRSRFPAAGAHGRVIRWPVRGADKEMRDDGGRGPPAPHRPGRTSALAGAGHAAHLLEQQRKVTMR